MKDNLKLRPLEINRQKRMMQLYAWGKTNIPSGELFETIAFQRLVNKASMWFNTTYPTSASYAKVVLARLRQEAIPA